MDLMHIAGKFGLVKHFSESGSLVRTAAEEGEQFVEHLSQVIRTKWASMVIEMEPADYSFELYPLATLVQNSADSFALAPDTTKEIKIHRSVERCPRR